MNMLVLDQGGKERAHQVALYASRPENWFRPGESTWTPGDRARELAGAVAARMRAALAPFATS